ncbi:unnamed protein product [Didymodactylos carnosus]|uniref:MULE transposase domain-containing protein n=1 Tax=Didymodactylos carnosus TaxID=1234261 RepID=A0A8S2EIV0_9BILA|nr:unnamed protein product [Didymodactylos carnosus]CAF4028370.1 unnamed protein product [Didymodactylos carnosus]
MSSSFSSLPISCETGLLPHIIIKPIACIHEYFSRPYRHEQNHADTKIKNIVQYSRSKTRKSIISIDDLQTWCNQYLNCSSPDKLHDAFVPYYEAIDINHIFICITTRQLLSACKYSSTLAIDCTYKITWNELPLLVFGTSDLYRHFHPLGLCLISTDESADTFKTLFRVLKSCVPLNH